MVAQALRAAAATVASDQAASSLHATFVVAGRGEEVLRQEVDRIRDGASFATRRVVVRQSHGVVLVATANFHHEEEGPEYQPDTPLDVAPADSLGPGRYDGPYVESRDVPVDPTTDPTTDPSRRAWFRVRVALPDEDAALQQQAIAYLSDYGCTRAAREPHAHLADDRSRQSVSLDHSVWFHRPANPTSWLLSELSPASTGRGRGLAVGSLRTATGVLVATVAQEVLLRTRPTARR